MQCEAAISYVLKPSEMLEIKSSGLSWEAQFVKEFFYVIRLGDHDVINKKLHHWQAEYGNLFRKYRECSTANKSYKRELESTQKKLDRFKALESLLKRLLSLQE